MSLMDGNDFFLPIKVTYKGPPGHEMRGAGSHQLCDCTQTHPHGEIGVPLIHPLPQHKVTAQVGRPTLEVWHGGRETHCAAPVIE